MQFAACFARCDLHLCEAQCSRTCSMSLEVPRDLQFRFACSLSFFFFSLSLYIYIERDIFSFFIHPHTRKVDPLLPPTCHVPWLKVAGACILVTRHSSRCSHVSFWTCCTLRACLHSLLPEWGGDTQQGDVPQGARAAQCKRFTCRCIVS